MREKLQYSHTAARVVAAICLLAAIFIVFIDSCSVDRGLGPTTQGIRGTVIFEGSWPDTIKEARVAVLRTYPATSVTDLAGFSAGIEPGADEVVYVIELSQGTYPFVGVVCRTGAEWDASSIECVLGYYEEPGSIGTPAAVHVAAGTFTDSVDIAVRFGK